MLKIQCNKYIYYNCENVDSYYQVNVLLLSQNSDKSDKRGKIDKV